MTLQGLYNKRDARTFHVRTCSRIHAGVHAPDYVYTMSYRSNSDPCYSFQTSNSPPRRKINELLEFAEPTENKNRLKCAPSGVPVSNSPPPTLLRDYNLRCITDMSRRTKNLLCYHPKVPNNFNGMGCGFFTYQIVQRPPILRFSGSPPLKVFFNHSRPPGREKNYHKKISLPLRAGNKKSYWRKHREPMKGNTLLYHGSKYSQLSAGSLSMSVHHRLNKLWQLFKNTVIRPPGSTSPITVTLFRKIIHRIFRTVSLESVPCTLIKTISTEFFSLIITRFVNLCTNQVLGKRYLCELRNLRQSPASNWRPRINKWNIQINLIYPVWREKSKFQEQYNINFQGIPPPLAYPFSTIFMQI